MRYKMSHLGLDTNAPGARGCRFKIGISSCNLNKQQQRRHGAARPRARNTRNSCESKLMIAPYIPRQRRHIAPLCTQQRAGNGHKPDDWNAQAAAAARGDQAIILRGRFNFVHTFLKWLSVTFLRIFEKCSGVPPQP